jgi:hypothetical protein
LYLSPPPYSYLSYSSCCSSLPSSYAFR